MQVAKSTQGGQPGLSNLVLKTEGIPQVCRKKCADVANTHASAPFWTAVATLHKNRHGKVTTANKRKRQQRGVKEEEAEVSRNARVSRRKESLVHQ